MAGHSKWAQIKHKKAVVDARRGKLFAKLCRAVEGDDLGLAVEPLQNCEHPLVLETLLQATSDCFQEIMTAKIIVEE
jgi:transcriptional/translational regulatory protein YebC/TACO1